MSTFGIEFAVVLPTAADVIDEKVENFYISLANNFALVNVDVSWNDDESTLAALVAVEAPDGFDPEEFVTGVASDAIKKALHDSGFIEASDQQEFTPSAKVLQFA